jgi:general secretion pathway protein G
MLRAVCCVLGAETITSRTSCTLRSNELEAGALRKDASSQHAARSTQHLSPGFTLIELLVVMAVIALLLAIAVPRYFHSTDRAKEAVLKQNLAQMRDAIDKYYGDKGRYPDELEDLITGKYLRRIPPDPITESTVTWVSVPPQPGEQGRIFDVKSGAPGAALDDTQYGDW